MSSDLYDIEIRNQVLIERLKAGQDREFLPYLRQIDELIRARLSEEGDFIETKKALNSVLADIRNGQIDIYSDYHDAFYNFLYEYALDQAELELEALNSMVVNVDLDAPSSEQVETAVRVGVMSVENYTGQPLLQSFVSDFTDKQIQLLNTAIQQGYSQGQTVDQITRRIRGTKANRYKDGDLSRVDRSNRAMVHTSIQNASSLARQSVWKKNKDIVKKYQWLSTLDSRTTRVCRSLDQQVFDVGEGPLPPMHVNCRSTTLPVVDKRYTLFGDDVGDRPSVGANGPNIVEGDETYYAWLKRQPASFQNEAIGPSRAKLLRDGGLSSDEFAKLNLNKNFEPLTLEQMRRLRPEVFERAGI